MKVAFDKQNNDGITTLFTKDFPSAEAAVGFFHAFCIEHATAHKAVYEELLGNDEAKARSLYWFERNGVITETFLPPNEPHEVKMRLVA